MTLFTTISKENDYQKIFSDIYFSDALIVVFDSLGESSLLKRQEIFGIL